MNGWPDALSFHNGYEIICSVDEQERVMLELAAGKMLRRNFSEWLNDHISHITNKD